MATKKVAVVGGGISGLSCAWFLRQRHLLNLSSSSSPSPLLSISLHEKDPQRFGGWIRTIRRSGFQFECGPFTLRSVGGEKAVTTLQLIEDLSLVDQTVEASLASRQNRYLWLDGRLQRMPSSPLQLLSDPLTKDLMWEVLSGKEWRQQKAGEADKDESVRSFFARRFASPRAADVFVDALCLGVFAAPAERLSMKACFPSFWEMEQKYGSLTRGALMSSFFGDKDKQGRGGERRRSEFVERMQRAKVYSFKQGMETLPAALARSLFGKTHEQMTMTEGREGGVHVVPSHSKLVAIAPLTSHCGAVLYFENGESMEVDHVISALPSYALAELLTTQQEDTDGMAQIAEDIRTRIAFSSVAVVHFGFRNDVLKGRRGFGYLVPSLEHEPILGVQWTSSTLPQQSLSSSPNNNPETKLTVMLPLDSHDYVLLKNQNSLLTDEERSKIGLRYKQVAWQTVKRHLEIEGEDSDVCWNVALNVDAIPCYQVGHLEVVAEVKARLRRNFPALHLVGGSWGGGVGLNDCIHGAKQLVDALQYYSTT
ncbi:oxygen-dependent protoporphyrinogen oxidase [Balamuthia mandrillaris]